MRILEGYQKGINLGGWFSQCDHTEERYDRFITDQDFSIIRSWGADHVRLPVDYELLENAKGEPRESGYARLEHVIGLCRKNSLRMVLDLHKTAGFSFDANEGEAGFFENKRYQERFFLLWERIANRFREDADIVAFELLNEVTEQSYRDTWNRIASECIARIRKIMPTVKILVGGYWHNSAVSVKEIDVPIDRNIVFNFHCYEPLIFTHQGAYWMETMDRSFRLPVSATFGEMDAAAKRMQIESCAGLASYPADTVLTSAYFEAFMAEAVQAAEQKNVPLYCGEYGVIDNASPEDALKWVSCIHAAFEKHGIGRAIWSYREMDFGISDARMDSVRKELLRFI